MNHALCYQNGYPRPQFVRSNWTSLNGLWQFCFDDDDIGETNEWYNELPQHRDITVPFAYQTPLSDINDQSYHKTVWYAKKHLFEKIHNNQRVILNFEGSDYYTKIWCNGKYIGCHTGGYCRFSFDITEALDTDGSAYLVLKIEDDKRADKPRGKQSWLEGPFGCWYTPTTGLWKSVWSEIVSDTRLEYVKMTPNPTNYHITFRYETNKVIDICYLKTVVSYKGNVIAEQINKIVRETNTYDIDLSNDLDSFKIHWWTPDNPQIYDVEFELYQGSTLLDKVGSYTAFRIFRTEGNKLMLNLNPIYLRMVLEQGYWRESGLTPKDEETIINEIEYIKKLGFNGARIHQKVEDERFFYYADIMGLLTFAEMPSFYEFTEEVSVGRIINEWIDEVKQHYNHPSVICWVPINESWGVNRITFNKQESHLSQTLYHLTKSLDPMRPVISNDGWEHTYSDILTFHNYCQDADKLAVFYQALDDVVNGKNRVDYSNLRLPLAPDFKYDGQPIMIDEFAGIGFRTANDEGWGYGDKVTAKEQFVNRLSSLIETITAKQDIAGFCITQITDVYQEINGLLDFDRSEKADFETLRKAITK